jgi:hypothetical protein
MLVVVCILLLIFFNRVKFVHLRIKYFFISYLIYRFKKYDTEHLSSTFEHLTGFHVLLERRSSSDGLTGILMCHSLWVTGIEHTSSSPVAMKKEKRIMRISIFCKRELTIFAMMEENETNLTHLAGSPAGAAGAAGATGAGGV